MRSVSILFTALLLFGPVTASAQPREPAPASDVDAVKTVLSA